MKFELQIRRAELEDATVLALLGQVTFREAFGDVWNNPQVLKDYFLTTFSVGKLRSSLSKSTNAYWIATANELPVGYVKMKKNCPYEKLPDPHPAQLQKIYVLQDYIGYGIGAQLQNAVFEEMHNEKIHCLWLAVWDQNDKGIRFYERHGFQKETHYSYDFQSAHFDYDVMTKYFTTE